MEKHNQEEVQTGRASEEKRSEREKVRREKIREGDGQKREDAGARKGRKVLEPLICDPGRSKSRLAKAAGAEPAGQMKDEKLHAVVARSTFASQNVQNISVEMSKSARRCGARCCGAKHI